MHMRTISSHFPASQQPIILPSIGTWRTARIPDVEAAAYVLPCSISHLTPKQARYTRSRVGGA